MKPTWKAEELLEYERQVAARPLHEMPGEVLEDILIPARGFMRARTLQPGQVIRFIDVEGQQVPDVILYDPKNLKNCSSMTNSVSLAKTWKLTTGHSIYAKFGQRMATIIADTVGTSVAMGGFCNPALNELRYGIEGTHSCRLNFVASMSDYNLSPADIEEGCFVPFQHNEYRSDGSVEKKPTPSKAGDYLELRADMAIIVAVSNCPSEHNLTNGWNPTPLRIVIYQPQTASI